jgi:hypothetical protein
MHTQPHVFGRATASHTVRLVTAVLAALLWVCAVSAQTPALSEYQVKALFLFNFAKYVDWPAESFSGNSAPIVIGLVGDDNFGDNLNRVIDGKSINGRPVVVKRVASEEEYKSCHILFVSASEKERMAEILNAVKDLATLTVGETDEFLVQEGMINLTKKENKIRVEINLIPAQRVKLKLSSKLLSVADTVMGKPEGKK